MTTYVVTGCDGGIGRSVAEILAKRGARILAVCHRATGAEALMGRFPAQVEAEVCDFGSLAEVQKLAERLLARAPQVSTLVNCAAAVFSEFGETPDGFERQLGINHLAPYLLTRRLWPAILGGSPSRVVIVASRAHRYIRLRRPDPEFRNGYNGLLAYRHTKLLNVLFAQELAHRAAGTGVSVVAVHPGVTKSTIGTANTRGWLWAAAQILQWFARPTERSAGEIAELASGPEVPPNGAYYSCAQRETPAAHALDRGDQRWAQL
jgi:NAD(P)-dependent dehydrogenase (short-subunit alcohol dehydrogenase family)